MTEENDAREFMRVAARVWAVLRDGSGSTIEGIIRDVSANGLFVQCDEAGAPGALHDVEIHLGARGAAITGRAMVVRRSDDGVALQFEVLDGVESFEHLRRLILFNANDADRVEAEFDSHVGIRPRDAQTGQE